MFHSIDLMRDLFLVVFLSVNVAADDQKAACSMGNEIRAISTAVGTASAGLLMPHRVVPPPPPKPKPKPNPLYKVAPPSKPPTPPAQTPTTRGGRGRGAGRGAMTGARLRRPRSNDYDRWQQWWAGHGEALLGIWRRPGEAGVVTGSAGFLVGRGPLAVHVRGRADANSARDQIVPALMGALAGGETKVIESALLALARIVPAEEGQQVLRAMVAALRHPQMSVRESAVLALGVLGDSAARSPLRAILEDSDRSHRPSGSTGPVPVHMRALAALSLGLIGDRRDLPVLMRCIDRRESGGRELAECAVVALGLVGESGRSEVAPYLLDLLDRDAIGVTVRARAAPALAQVVDPAASRITVRSLASRLRRSSDVASDVRRGCVMALGAMTSVDDRETLDLLYRILRDEAETRMRLAAIMALGEVGRRGVEAGHERHENQGRIQRVLLNEVRRPKRRAHRPWAALSVGLYARALLSADPSSAHRIGELLLSVYREESDSSRRGALALGVGLCDVDVAAQRFLADLQGSRDPEFTRSLALAVGFLDLEGGRVAIRDLLADRRCDALTRVSLARGLAMMGDAKASRILVEMLMRSSTVYETANLAQAIGMLGDRASVDPLIRLLGDRARPVACRDYAAAALGLLAEKTRMRWNIRVTAGIDHWIPNEALSLVADLL